MVFLTFLLSCTVSAPPVPPGQIAFMREGRVWVIGADGSGEQALTGELYYKTERPITWMPDGRRLLYWNHSRGGWDIWAVNAEDQEATNLTQVKTGGCRSPAPSPDGKWIAFLRDDPEGVYLMDADGKNQRRLTEKGFRDYAPSWSPDSRRLAYSLLEDNAFTIRCYDIESKQDTLLAKGWSPCWSPDGKWLLFEGGRKERTLSLMSANGGADIALTNAAGTTPAWSPDGSRVAYYTLRDDQTELRVVSVDRKSDALVASVEGRSWSAPSWSPDGKWLTFAAGAAPAQVVYVVDFEGHHLRKLVGGGACFPVWRLEPVMHF